ncbi:hypothetical protein H0H92_008941, partial [Tricholoma furcatifolium]
MPQTEPESDHNQSVTQQLQPTLEQQLDAFRNGDVSRAAATRSILRTFDNARVPDRLQDAAETHYLEQLDTIHRQRNQQLERGSGRTEPGNASQSSP